MKILRTCLLAVTVSATAASGVATPVEAGPMPVVATALRQAAPDHAADVRYRRNNGGALIAGAAIGLIGGLIASQAYAPHYDYYYGGGYAPVYYGPAYGPVTYGPYVYPPAYYPAYPYAGGPYVVYRSYPAYRVYRPVPVYRAYRVKRVRRSHR
jgi:hypothetical protein